MKKSIFVLAAVLALAPWITPSIAARAQTRSLVKADFRDATDASGAWIDKVRSDFGTSFAVGLLANGFQPCGVDYVDKTDPCTPAQTGDRNSVSTINAGTYFLRTLLTCCDTDPNGPVNNPTRWLVLDFSAPGGSTCQNLDLVISSYPGRSADAKSPLNADSCIDYLEVRFFADKAFNSRAQVTPVNIVIDAPDLVTTRQGSRTQWNAKFTLDFVNPLPITRNPDGTVRLATVDPTAELWTINQTTGQKETLLGTYQMPFAVTLKQTQ